MYGEGFFKTSQKAAVKGDIYTIFVTHVHNCCQSSNGGGGGEVIAQNPCQTKIVALIL